jgi:hypothetical protein
MGDLPSFLAERALAALSGRVSPSRARTRAAAHGSSQEGASRPDGRTDGRTRRAGLAGQGFELGWNRRRSLAPVIGALALLAAAETGHWIGAGRWVALLAGAPALVAQLWVHGRQERAFVAIGAAAAALWAFLVAAAGVTGPLFAVLVVGTLGATVWWRRYRVRGRIEIVGVAVQLVPVGEWWKLRQDREELRAALSAWAHGLPSTVRLWLGDQRYRWRCHRDLGRIIGDWSTIATNAGIPRGSRVLRAIADRTAYVLVVKLKPGTTHRKALDREDDFGSSLGALRGTVRVIPQPQMDRIHIRWLHDDPLAAAVIPWLGETVSSITERIKLGIYKDGRAVLVCLADALHTLVCGTTQWGKTSIVKTIVASLAGAKDAVLIVLDPKGVEFPELAPVIAHLIEPPEVYGVVRGLRRVMRVRKVMLQEAGERTWSPKLGPYIVVVLDEFSDLKLQVKDQVLKVAQKGLYVGIRLVIILQTPDQHAMGRSTALRAQLVRRISTHMEGEGIVREVFGDRARDDGWTPQRLPAKGDFLIKGDALGEPIDARAMYPDQAILREVAARETCTRLDPRSAEAFAAPDSPDDDEEDEGGEVTVLRFPAVPAAPQLVQPREVALWSGQAGQDLERLADAIRTAPGPVTGREAQARSGLSQHFVYDRAGAEGARKGGLGELERRGWIAEVEGKWVWTREADRSELDAAGDEGAPR